MSKTNEQGLTASQQELLLVWTGHMEATIAHVSDYEPLVTMGFAVHDVHPVTLETTYRATPAGIAVGHTIATLRAQAEALAEREAEAEPEPTRLLWMAVRSDTYYPDTASPDPKTAALDAFEGWGDDEPVTVAEFRASDVANMLPDDLFGSFLENLAESLWESYTEDSAEGEILSALYYKARGEKHPVHDEVNALLRPAFEAWWRRHAAGYGVHANYASTGQEQTFTPEELKTQVTP